MSLKLLLIMGFVNAGVEQIQEGAYLDAEVDLDAVQIINHWGYTGERHAVQTPDGYILETHRITGRNGRAGKPSKGVFILQHGLECSSDNWILNPPESSIGFLLSDAGFDVWMPNSRGNRYSSHLRFNRSDNAFWTYTWDDMQMFDLPSVFDYIKAKTGVSKVYYAGHSQGTVTMFAKLAADPEFGRNIIRFFALGPAATLHYQTSTLGFLCRSDVSTFAHPYWVKMRYTEMGVPFLSPDYSRSFFKQACQSSVADRQQCADAFYSFWGPSNQSIFNVSRIAVYLTHIPTGSSVANVEHHCQSNNDNTFHYYDYGTSEENERVYNQTKPPFYNLSRISGPKAIHLIYSKSDIITPYQDLAEYLMKKLPAQYSNQSDWLDVPDYAHMDFLWSVNINKDVVQPILQFIKQDEEVQIHKIETSTDKYSL